MSGKRPEDIAEESRKNQIKVFEALLEFIQTQIDRIDFSILNEGLDEKELNADILPVVTERLKRQGKMLPPDQYLGYRKIMEAIILRINSYKNELSNTAQWEKNLNEMKQRGGFETASLLQLKEGYLSNTRTYSAELQEEASFWKKWLDEWLLKKNAEISPRATAYTDRDARTSLDRASMDSRAESKELKIDTGYTDEYEEDLFKDMPPAIPAPLSPLSPPSPQSPVKPDLTPPQDQEKKPKKSALAKPEDRAQKSKRGKQTVHWRDEPEKEGKESKEHVVRPLADIEYVRKIKDLQAEMEEEEESPHAQVSAATDSDELSPREAFPHEEEFPHEEASPTTSRTSLPAFERDREFKIDRDLDAHGDFETQRMSSFYQTAENSEPAIAASPRGEVDLKRFQEVINKGDQDLEDFKRNDPNSSFQNVQHVKALDLKSDRFVRTASKEARLLGASEELIYSRSFNEKESRVDILVPPPGEGNVDSTIWFTIKTNKDFLPLDVDPCGDPNLAIKIWLISILTKDSIILHEDDMRLLRSTPEFADMVPQNKDKLQDFKEKFKLYYQGRMNAGNPYVIGESLPRSFFGDKPGPSSPRSR